MTRAVLVLCLVASLSFAARSFLHEGANVTGSGAALAFGFLLLAALQTGHVFHALRLPHLTGYILCGAVFGPEVLGLLTHAMIADLTLVKKVAVSLIALTAGCELNFKKLAPRIRSIGAVSFFGLLLAALALFGAFFAITSVLPLSSGMSTVERAVVSMLCSNVLIAFSPAVVMGILSETKAEGPLSELCLSIVVLADLVVAVTFALSSSFARRVFPAEGVETSAVSALTIHILGSMVVGLGVGAILALYVRRVALRVGLFVFALCFVVAEVGSALHLDPLLMGLTAGLFVENVSPVGGHEVIHRTEIAAMPTYAVFFAVIGAEIHVHAFASVAPYAIAAAVARAAGIWAGARLGARLSGVPPELARRVPLGMLPQAGIALALANIVKESFRGWGEDAATLLFGTILVNEMLGPVLFRTALAAAGEIAKKTDLGAVGRPSHASIPDDVRSATSKA